MYDALAVAQVRGWILLVLGVGVGLVAYPLQYFRVAGASLVVLAAMMIFVFGSSRRESHCCAGALAGTDSRHLEHQTHAYGGVADGDAFC